VILKKRRSPGAAEVLRRLVHRRIDVRERGDGIEINDRIERKCLDDCDTPKLMGREPVDRCFGP
jgi:hypothetical protein